MSPSSKPTSPKRPSPLDVEAEATERAPLTGPKSSRSSRSPSPNREVNGSAKKRKRDDERDEEEDSDDVSSEDNSTKEPYKPFRKTLVEGEPGTMTGRPLRLYADGIFDLFHVGHAKALEQCKKAYPNTYLLVGCCSDELTHKLKGRTVLADTERYESLRHCKWVDEVVEDAPWVVDDAFTDKHKIDYICHDAIPYTDASGESGEGSDVYAHWKKRGMFLETLRTEGISTSDIIVRIISQYDTFIRRNLARGYTGKEMNVPFMKEQSIKLDMAVDKIKGKVEHEVHGIEERVLSFLKLFSKNGGLRRQFRKRRRLIKDKITEFAQDGLC